MRDLAARVYFAACLIAGRLLRAARYSTVRVIVRRDGSPLVRKRRRFYAPLLIWLSEWLAWMLDGGVRVLPQREWEERERRIHRTLRGTSIEADRGVLVVPFLPGRTLAALLEDPELKESDRRNAIELAAIALAGLHRLGFTHGDAMAENVLVELDAGVANWFDFETEHDEHRPPVWRRADDVRALLATCVVRTAPARHARTLELILQVCADEDITHAVAASFASVWRRSLTYDLVQAKLSYECFRDLGRLLRERPSRTSTNGGSS